MLSDQQMKIINHLKLQIFRPELMIDFLPNAVEYYARACPSLKTFKLHIGIMPTIRRWGLFEGPHDCDKLKDIAASAVKLCDKVGFEIWEEVAIPQDMYADLRILFATQES
jgi:hypothetical protein